MRERTLQNILLWLLLILISCSCSEAIKRWVKGGKSNPPATTSPSVVPQVYTWNFSDPLAYTFDANYLAVTNGKLTLKEVGQIHTNTDFNGGNYVGTYLDAAGNLGLVDPKKYELDGAWAPQGANLTAYWKFNGDYTTSKGVNTLTKNGTPSFSNLSKVGSHAAVFNGSTDYYSVAREKDYATGLSVSTWVNLSDMTSTNRILYRMNGQTWYPRLAVYSNGGVSIQYRLCAGTINAYSPAGFVTSDDWYHVAATLDPASGGKVYVNGVLVGSDATTGACISGGGNDMLIGYDPDTANYFNGKIDEVGIWDVILSANEIATIYDQQKNAPRFVSDNSLSPLWTPKYTDIVGYWKMDGDWLDFSGNENHGTANGDAAFSSASKIGSQTGTFDGTGDFINIGNPANLDITEKITISAWIRVNSFDEPWSPIITRGDSTYRLQRNNTNNTVAFAVNISVSTYTAGGTTAVNDGLWHYVVGTFDGLNSKIYVDGILEGTISAVGVIDSAPIDVRIGQNTQVLTREWNGDIDDVAIWSTDLNITEINSIYDRQKQKYAGHYESSIINLGVAGSWDNLAVKTALPFFKELPSTGEVLNDYPTLRDANNVLGNSDLSNASLVGLWKLNGPIGAIIDGTAIVDSSFAGGQDGTVVDGDATNTIRYANGIMSEAISFDGVNDSISLSDTPFDIVGDFSMSAWVNLNSIAGNQTILCKAESSAYCLEMNSSKWQFAVHDGSNYRFAVANDNAKEGVWTFVTSIVSGTAVSLYINGTKQSIEGVLTGPISTNNLALTIGANPPGSDYLDGHIDEVAVWSRALDPVEIQQLYRRGGNRLKYQVKSCVDSTCECKSLDALGDANDCDGDGTPNTSDSSDIHSTQWLGNNGTAGGSFSELQNCSIIDTVTGICDIASMSTVNATAPIFDFSRYPPAAQPINNRYFQYRVTMEAEENTACSGTPCLPELTSVEVGPSGRYFGGTYVITSSASVAFAGLTDISFNTLGNCTLTYQLSPDGTNYYYWNGSSWAVGTGVGQSVTGAIISANISTFVSQAGGGNLYWKAFMNSNTVQACEIDSIVVTVVQ